MVEMQKNANANANKSFKWWKCKQPTGDDLNKQSTSLQEGRQADRKRKILTIDTIDALGEAMLIMMSMLEIVDNADIC